MDWGTRDGHKDARQARAHRGFGAAERGEFERIVNDERLGVPLEEAIRESHYAWQQDRDNPDVFDKMIEIHCEAAQARRGPDSYADAQRWLLCANQHDEGNGRVRELLAERHYLQARHLSDQGRRKEALQTLELCLAWDPEHSGGRTLQTALRRRAP